MDIYIQRAYYGDCTLGRLFIPTSSFQCFTLELPWLNNQPNISCISEGTYSAKRRLSPANGDVIELENVLNRTHIQIHKGNYTKDILGCILVGESIKFLDSDSIPDVTNSARTMGRLLSQIKDSDITIHVGGAGRPVTPLI